MVLRREVPAQQPHGGEGHLSRGEEVEDHGEAAAGPGDLPDGVELRPMGDQRLRDIDRPEPLHELQIDGVTTAPASTTMTAPDADLESAVDPDVRGPTGLDIHDPDLGWLGGTFAKVGQRTGELIERRVLAELSEAFGSRARRGESGVAPEPPPVPERSVADEISRLQSLRNAGALTDEQYARAVDRVIEGGD